MTTGMSLRGAQRRSNPQSGLGDCFPHTSLTMTNVGQDFLPDAPRVGNDGKTGYTCPTICPLSLRVTKTVSCCSALGICRRGKTPPYCRKATRSLGRRKACLVACGDCKIKGVLLLVNKDTAVQDLCMVHYISGGYFPAEAQRRYYASRFPV